MKIEGLEEVSKQLEKLGNATSGRVVRQAVGFAVTPVVKEARRRAPVGDRIRKNYKGRLLVPGNLSRSIRKGTFKSKSGLYARASVGAQHHAFYGPAFVEKGVRGKARVEPNKFLSDSFAAKHEEMKRRFASKLRKAIDKVSK